MNGTDLESSGRLASLTWSPPVACEWLWRGNERYETEGMHTQSHSLKLKSMRSRPTTSLSHLMKKCELKPVGSGTATAAFGEVAAWLW